VVKRFRLLLCTKEKLLQICSHLLLSSCRAGAALLLLPLLPCSEHGWSSSHPGQAAGLPRLLCTLLPHKLDKCARSAPWCGMHHLQRHACSTCTPPCAGVLVFQLNDPDM